jgi:hypothetical protein
VLKEVAGEHLFKIPAAGHDEGTELAMNKAIAIAETLRVADRQVGNRKADGNADPQ